MASTAPRWKAGLARAIGENGKAAVFQLASIENTTNTPRVRSHIHREFLAAKTTPSLPILVTSTDIRTPKTTQILPVPTIEAVFWIEANQEQYRIIGDASIIPAPSHPYHGKFDPLHGPALAAVTKEGIDWEARRKQVFNSMSGYMKASWCRPTPGSKLEGGYEEAKNWPQKLPSLEEAESDEDRKNLEVALSNFALVVIEPYEVDFVELGVIPNQRTKFTRQGLSWVEEILVP